MSDIGHDRCIKDSNINLAQLSIHIRLPRPCEISGGVPTGNAIPTVCQEDFVRLQKDLFELVQGPNLMIIERNNGI